jgi:hypothetical protein
MTEEVAQQLETGPARRGVFGAKSGFSVPSNRGRFNPLPPPMKGLGGRFARIFQQPLCPLAPGVHLIFPPLLLRCSSGIGEQFLDRIERYWFWTAKGTEKTAHCGHRIMVLNSS